MKRACVITTAHNSGDNRIYHREISSLLCEYRVIYITTDGEVAKLPGLKIIKVGSWHSRWQRLGGALKAFRYARKLNADIYHFHDPEFVLLAVLLKWLTGRPIIYDIHENYPAVVMGREWIPGPLRGCISLFTDIGERLTIPLLDGIICASEAIAERYIKLNRRCTVVHNYPSPEIINKHYSDQKTQDIICLGDLNEIRGARIVFPAIIKYLKKHDGKFHLIGDVKPESLKQELTAKIPKELRPRIIITGRQNYDDAIRLAAHGSVGLLSYMNLPNHVESSPNKLYEYMGLGLAILATDLPGYRRIISNDKVGIIYKDDSSLELEKALDKILSSPKLRQMQETGRKHFLERYNWKSEEKILYQLYKEIMG